MALSSKFAAIESDDDGVGTADRVCLTESETYHYPNRAETSLRAGFSQLATS